MGKHDRSDWEAGILVKAKPGQNVDSVKLARLGNEAIRDFSGSPHSLLFYFPKQVSGTVALFLEMRI